MTSGDNKHIDAQLEALLLAMPQPRPSAELDAAILADAEAALAKNPVAARTAANDAVTPESANAKRPAFLVRWKVPLAFAATFMLAVHIVGLQWFANPVYDAPEAGMAATDAAPAAPPPVASAADAPSTAASRLRREAPAAKPVEQARAKDSEAKAAAASPRKEARSRAAPAQAGAGLAEEKSSDSAGPPAALAKKSDAAPLKSELAPVMGAIAAAPAPAPAAAPAPAPRAPAAIAMATPSARAAPAPAVGESQSIGGSQMEAAKPSVQAQMARPALPERSENATVATGAKGLAAGALQDAPQASATAGMPAAKIAGAPAEARAARSAPQPAGTLGAGVPAATDSASSIALSGMADRVLKAPKDWLAQIDKLIADGKRKEALEEWTRFRKQYPDYQVAPEQQKRIDALKE